MLASLADGQVLVVERDSILSWSKGAWHGPASPSRRYFTWIGAYDLSDEATATPLDGGRVLLVGGRDANGNSLGADVWIAATETWTNTRMIHPRIHHTATALDDGRVLVVGGEGPPRSVSAMSAPRGQPSRETELWDAKRGFVAGAPMREVRADHAAVHLADGRVLVVGGRQTDPQKPLRTAEIWAPKTSTWSAVAPMREARAGHSATLLDDGRVLVMGGDASSTPNTAEIYDPVANTWSTAGPLPELWIHHHTIRLPDGRILVTTENRSLLVSRDR